VDISGKSKLLSPLPGIKKHYPIERELIYNMTHMGILYNMTQLGILYNMTQLGVIYNMTQLDIKHNITQLGIQYDITQLGILYHMVQKGILYNIAHWRLHILEDEHENSTMLMPKACKESQIQLHPPPILTVYVPP
jgi:hypothetical protein